MDKVPYDDDEFIRLDDLIRESAQDLLNMEGVNKQTVKDILDGAFQSLEE